MADRSLTRDGMKNSLEGKTKVAKGRVKDRNMRRDPRVSMALIDPDNPYRYLQLQGRVVEITENGADQHIDKMAKKYLGKDKYPNRAPGEVRVLYKIEPERAARFEMHDAPHGTDKARLAVGREAHDLVLIAVV